MEGEPPGYAGFVFCFLRAVPNVDKIARGPGISGGPQDVPVISADGEVGYRNCLSSGCCDRILIDWVAYKQHKLIFHGSGG